MSAHEYHLGHPKCNNESRIRLICLTIGKDGWVRIATLILVLRGERAQRSQFAKGVEAENRGRNDCSQIDTAKGGGTAGSHRSQVEVPNATYEKQDIHRDNDHSDPVELIDD